MALVSPPVDCDSCGGVCCYFRSGTALLVEADFRRWQDAGRDDLMSSRVPGHFGQEGLAVDARGACTHLDDNGRCSIHEIRPNTCRDFPIGCAQCLCARRLAGLPNSSTPR